MKANERVEMQLYLLLTSAMDGSDWTASQMSTLISGKDFPVPIDRVGLCVSCPSSHFVQRKMVQAIRS